jgi:hypothetical protein
MTDTAETFRQGATAYRHTRDWAQEQRDEAIGQANERAGDSQATAIAVDASFGQVYSFTSEPTLDETYTTEDSNTTHLQDSETSSVELSLDSRLPVKRSSTHSKRPPRLKATHRL